MSTKSEDEKTENTETQMDAPTLVEPTDETASSRIRDAARKMIPGLVAGGRDPANKKIYAPIVVELSKKEGVARTTGQKAWDKVLREFGSGKSAANADAPSVSKTVGGVHASIIGSPKVVTIEGVAAAPMSIAQGQSVTDGQVCRKCGKSVPPNFKFCPECGEEVGKAKGVEMTEEELDDALKDTIQFPTHMLYKVAEKAWDVKIDEPDEKDYERLGKKWGKVIRAYGVDIPKFALVLIAASSTGAQIALPLILARGESVEAAKKKLADEAEGRKRTAGGMTNAPVVAAPTAEHPAEPKKEESSPGVS